MGNRVCAGRYRADLALDAAWPMPANASLTTAVQAGYCMWGEWLSGVLFGLQMQWLERKSTREGASHAAQACRQPRKGRWLSSAV